MTLCLQTGSSFNICNMKHLLDFLFDQEYPEVFEVEVDNQFYHVYLVVSDLITFRNYG